MPVRRATAYALLKAFGELEFELKKVPAFLPSAGQRAKVNWPAVDETIRALPGDRFLDLVSPQTRAKMLGGARNRPMVQKVLPMGGVATAVYRPRALPNNDGEALAEATRRVRNNLFHGGKEDPLEEQYPGDDQEWATAAREVATLLLILVRHGQLAPP